MSGRPKGFGRSSRDDAAASRHFWPGTEVLRNKANLRNRAALDAFERRTVARASQSRAPMRTVSYLQFKQIHRHLFAEVYDWAGTERDYATGRGPAPFCLPEYIGPSMERLFAELRAERNLKGTTLERFAERAAYYANEINAVHPFIEGNGRTLREFLHDLAASAGHRLDMTKLDRASWYAASAAGFSTADPEPLRRCLAAALTSPTSRRRPPARRR